MREKEKLKNMGIVNCDDDVYEAIMENDLARVKQFIAPNRSLLDCVLDGHTPLTLACAFARVAIARYLYRKGVDVNKRTDSGDHALHCAVGDDESCVRLLLQHPQIEVNATNRLEGNTPLHDAAFGQFGKCAILLLNHPKIDRTIKNRDGKTASQIAKFNVKHLFATEKNTNFKTSEPTDAIKQAETELARLEKEAAAKRQLLDKTTTEYRNVLNETISAQDNLSALKRQRFYQFFIYDSRFWLFLLCCLYSAPLTTIVVALVINLCIFLFYGLST